MAPVVRAVFFPLGFEHDIILTGRAALLPAVGALSLSSRGQHLFAVGQPGSLQCAAPRIPGQ